jgi:serine/threonine protein kinase
MSIVKLGNRIRNNKGTNYTIGELFKESSFPIYELKIDGMTAPLLLKVIPFTDKYGDNEYRYNTELKYLKRASIIGVCPELIHYEILSRNSFDKEFTIEIENSSSPSEFICSQLSRSLCPGFLRNRLPQKKIYRIGIFIMEKFGEGTLTDLYNMGVFENVKYKSNISLQLKKILDKLYENGIKHNDLHSNNFLYHYDQAKDKYIMKIIDFDQSKNFRGERNYNIEIVDSTAIINVKKNSNNNKTQKRKN